MGSGCHRQPASPTYHIGYCDTQMSKIAVEYSSCIIPFLDVFYKENYCAFWTTVYFHPREPVDGIFLSKKWLCMHIFNAFQPKFNFLVHGSVISDSGTVNSSIVSSWHNGEEEVWNLQQNWLWKWLSCVMWWLLQTLHCEWLAGLCGNIQTQVI